MQDSSATSSENMYTGVLYCVQLVHVPESEPLYGIRYYGQAVRIGSAIQVATSRWKEEMNDAVKKNKQVGLLAALSIYGSDAFEWEIIMSIKGPRPWVQELVDVGEIGLIAEAGGTLQDMNQRLAQTLNLQDGGKCKTGRWWGSIDAFRNEAFLRFKAAMEVYVSQFGTSLVPWWYRDPLTNYSLGPALANFRSGKFRSGMRNQDEIEAWAEALPKWTWKPLESADYWQDASNRSRKQAAQEPNGYRSKRHFEWHANMSYAEREAQRAKIKEVVSAPEVRQATSQGVRMWHANMSKTDKEKRSKQAREQAALEPEGYRSQRHIKWRQSETTEAKSIRLGKRKATFAAKAEKRLSLLSPEMRRKEESIIAQNERAAAKRAAELQRLRVVKPDAKQCDIARAKREGWMPNEATQ